MYLLMTTGLHLKTYKDFSSFGDLGPTKGIQQVSIITWDNEFGENKHGNTWNHTGQICYHMTQHNRLDLIEFEQVLRRPPPRSTQHKQQQQGKLERQQQQQQRQQHQRLFVLQLSVLGHKRLSFGYSVERQDSAPVGMVQKLQSTGCAPCPLVQNLCIQQQHVSERDVVKSFETQLVLFYGFHYVLLVYCNSLSKVTSPFQETIPNITLVFQPLPVRVELLVSHCISWYLTKLLKCRPCLKGWALQHANPKVSKPNGQRRWLRLCQGAERIAKGIEVCKLSLWERMICGQFGDILG